MKVHAQSLLWKSLSVIAATFVFSFVVSPVAVAQQEVPGITINPLATESVARLNPYVAKPVVAPQQSQALSSEVPQMQQLLETFQAESFESSDQGASPLLYRWMGPADWDSKSEQSDQAGYPLVIFLHGAGERGEDNAKQLKHVAGQFARADRRAEFPAFVVFPQCPEGKKWVEVDWGDKKGIGTFSDEPSESMASAFELIDQLCEQWPIDRTRVYVGGLSMGGYGTWFAASHGADRFAAAVPICGGGDPEWASRYKGVPLWAFHGDQDSVVPVRRSREMVAALATAGHQPELRYTEYAGAGHDTWTRTFERDDVFAWLFSQRRESTE